MQHATYLKIQLYTGPYCDHRLQTYLQLSSFSLRIYFDFWLVEPEKTKTKSPQEAGIKMLMLGDVARCKALRWFCVSGGCKGHFAGLMAAQHLIPQLSHVFIFQTNLQRSELWLRFRLSTLNLFAKTAKLYSQNVVFYDEFSQIFCILKKKSLFFREIFVLYFCKIFQLFRKIFAFLISKKAKIFSFFGSEQNAKYFAGNSKSKTTIFNIGKLS